MPAVGSAVATQELLMATPGARRVVRASVPVRVPLRVTSAQLHEIVLAAWHGTGPCLQEGVHRALWGTSPAPERWGDWSKEARAAWDEAVALYHMLSRASTRGAVGRLGTGPGRPSGPHAADLDDMWAAVRLVTDTRLWPRCPHLTWTKVAQAIGCDSRVASYRAQVQGWTWGGRNSARTLLTVPCLRCGEVCAAGDVDPRTGLGPCCAGVRRRRA